MGFKEWLSLDFSKRHTTSEPPSPAPPQHRKSHRQTPQRRESAARSSYYQPPVQRQADHEQGAEYYPAPSRQQQQRLSRQQQDPYNGYADPRQHYQPRRAPSRVEDHPYQSESGYYFEENGVDNQVEQDRQSLHAARGYDRPSDRRVSGYDRESVHDRSSVHERSSVYERGSSHGRASLHDRRQSIGRRDYEDGEPIVVRGIDRHRMAPQSQSAHGQPSGEIQIRNGREQRGSRVARQTASEEPPHESHQRNSILETIRLSWLGGGRSHQDGQQRNGAADGRAQQNDAPSSEVVMNGWLEKCGQQFKTWNWRFFVLRADGILSYYADDKMKKFKGSINVGYGSKADISMQSHMIEKKFVFMIATDQRNMMISAPSQKMMTKWIAKLHAAGATPSEPWDPSKKTIKFFVRDSERPHEWKRYDDPTSYIHMEGCLMKRGHVNKNWKNRFFRIEKGELRYYTENQDQLRGSVPLKGTIVSPGMTQAPDGRKNYFVLTSKDATFEMHLSAPNEQLMHRWIEALQEAQTALGGKGNKGTVSGLALVIKHAEEIPLATIDVVYEAPELINVELERRTEALVVVSCRAGTVPVGSQLITVGTQSILRDTYTAARHALRAAVCPLRLQFLLPPYKKGELIKKSRSGLENWKRRVVIVTNGEIQYYKQVANSANEKVLKHRKTFPLYGCYLNLIQMPSREYCIIVARSPTDKLVLEARNEAERIEWASVIYCTIRMVSQGVTSGHIENLQLEVARDPSAVASSDINGSFQQMADLGL